MTLPSDDADSDEALARIYQADPAGAIGRAAAERLLGRWRARVYGWCFRRVGEHERALDLAQETLVGALESLHRFDGRSRFSSWLYAIARNRCVSAFRLRRLARDPEVDPDEIGIEDDPAERLAGREAEERLLELMRVTLEPIEQDALWLRVVEELPVDEITRRLGVAGASGARALLQTARRKLRAALEAARRRAARAEGGRP